MRKLSFPLILLLISCGSAPDPQPVPPAPNVPDSVPENIDAEHQPDPYQRWLLNEYDIWQYLKNNPAETDVLSTLGQPDSVFMDFDQTYRVYYYFIPKLNDYNSIEIDIRTGQVTGFEWD